MPPPRPRMRSIPCDAAMVTGLLKGYPDAVARFFGPAVLGLVNLIFLISSCAVLDSTFSSTSKLFGPEALGLLETGRPQPPQLATQRWMGGARGRDGAGRGGAGRGGAEGRGWGVAALSPHSSCRRLALCS
jgi:hypothetical protein